MTEIATLRIRNPDALEAPGLYDVVERAFSDANAPVGPDVAIPELQRLVPRDSVGFFIGRSGDQYASVALVTASPSPLLPDASIYYFYNEGGAALRHAMMLDVVGFARTHGCDTLTAVNRNGRDEAFKRLFEPDLGRGEPLGAAIRFHASEKVVP